MSRKSTPEDIVGYCAENDVGFVRLAFCDAFGRQKNVSIMSGELPRAFRSGIAFDGSAVRGFEDSLHSDLFLHPDPDTFAVLPWRPDSRRVGRMFCAVKTPDGKPHAHDARSRLKAAAAEAKRKGMSFRFGMELRFGVLPADGAGYMDTAPDDCGEDIRRRICLSLEQMGIHLSGSYHAGAAGQSVIEPRDMPRSKPPTA